MSVIKLQVRKCRVDSCGLWLVSHDGNLLDMSINQTHAMQVTDYWVKSFREYRP